MVKAIVGANWGDEGKGKLTDVLALQSDIVVRFQGGANAGHTIINDYGKFALHLLPSGVFHPHITNVIGTGVALDISALLEELDTLKTRGVPKPTLLISDRAQVLMPYHVLLDTLEETRLGKNSFGSTRSGIAPFYSDKYAKIGLQVCQLYEPSLLRERLNNIAAQKNVLFKELYHAQPLDTEAIAKKCESLAAAIQPMVCDTGRFLREAVKAGKNVLLEGQLGTLRDPDHGIFPFTTSSSPLAGFGSVGAGVAPTSITDVVCVTKAYSSCVGAGPFTTELEGMQAEDLRRRGGDAGEYGAKTGRPRRVGWFDAVATRYGCEAQGATECAMTNLDVLSYLPEIPVCVAYEVDGERTEDFPVTPKLERATPIYETLPGWMTDIRGAKSFDELPEACKNYVLYIERKIGTPIRMLSNGPRREELIRR